MAYEDLMLDELKAEFLKLAEQLDVISENRRQVFSLIQKREAEAAAAVKVSDMNELQKDALRHVLGPAPDAKAPEAKAP